MSPNHQRLRNSHRAPLFLPLTTLILWTFLVPLLRDNGASVVAEWDRLSVKPTFDCHKFSNDPKACRAAYCHYRCCDRTCQSGKNASAAETCGMDPCSRHCFDVFSCRRENATYCEYDVVGGNCRKGDYYKNCRDDLFRMNECRELGKFYIDAGIPCKNFIESGNCKQIEVVRAVNINGEEVFDHVKSIRYRPDGPFLYVDDHGTRMSRETYENVTGTFPHLQSLYQTFLVGKDRLPEDSRCLKYWIPIEMAGSYQLTLHLQEPKFEEEGKRYFNVKFNGHGILMEVDLFKLIGAKNHAAEFVLQFEVESDDILWLKGYMPSIIHNKRVDLAFCQGSHAEHNTAYVGSAFSVLRFTGSQGSTLDADLKPNAKPIIPAEELCAAIGNNLCECKKSGCEYDVREKACKYGKTACPFLDLGWNICRKPGSFLAHGGLICPVEVQEGNCKIVKVIKAFNLNGIEHTDKEDVTYKPEDTNPSHFLDSGKTRVGRKIPPHGNCHGTPPIREIDFHDLSLYSSLVYGSSSKRDSGHCLTYLIPVEEDGRYLLTIKTVDSTQQHAGSRLFNVRFQDVLIIPELDIVRSVGNCAGMDILINFHKRLDGLFMSGHPGGALLKQKNARLSFCYSGCDVWNKNFVVSAFSLLKLEETDSPTMVTVTATPSTKMTKPTTTAVSPNTSPFTTTTTWKPLTNLQCNHSSLIGNPCQCREARCEFNIHTGRCSGRDPPCTSSITKWTGCRRPGAFYARAGVVCKNTVEEGECPSDDLILAVNIGGRELVSHSNIKYLADNPNLYKDPYGTRFAFDNNWDGYRCKQQFSNLLLIDKIHRSEWGLYSHMVQGKESLEEGCLSYPINVKRQGVYELTIKTAEEHHFSPKRSFTVLLNNQFVLYSFHILDYVPACTRMDIVIPFHVQNRLLTIFGFPEPSAIEGHSIDLSFCFTPTGCADHKLNYVVAAFHVLRVKGLTDITQLESHSTGSEGQQPLENYTYDGDEAAYFRECKKAGFEVDVANRRCVFGKRHCNPSVDWQECESQNSFYAHGGAICKGSSYKRGHCPQTVVTTAINFGGGRFKGRDDQRSGTGGGIAYHPEKNIVYNDPGGIRVVQDLKPSHCKKSPGGEVQVGGIMKENNGLYSTEVTAAPKTDGNKDNCLTYPLKVTGNGKYKVVVKMAELRHKGSGIRHFRLNLNKLVLAEELDITRYVSPCSGFNLISTFEILGDQLHLSGYNTPSAVLHNQVPLSFCYGSCDPSETCDPKFVGGSVHLIKFADLKLLTPPGTAPVYPVSTPRPQTKGPQSSNCNEVTDECDCRAKGCVFSSLIGKTTLDPTDDDQCQPSEVLCKGIYNGISCRRPGPEVVYSYGGLPCKSVFNSANCLVNKTIYGVNLFSGSFVDKRGIRYVKDNNFANGAIAGKLKNVSGTADSCARLHNTTPFPNVFLYRQIAYFGNHDDKTDPEEEDLCLSYQILIMENGLYELSIKMMDYRQHLQKQYFNIFFNGVLIQRSFRILDFVSYCEPLDVVIEFSVRFRKMSITGSQQLIPIPSNGIVELKFCNNDCRLDFALSLAAISVAKLKLDYHPAISGSGQGQGAPEGCLLVPDGPFKQCQCQAVRGCQFNYETGKCTHANYSCPKDLDLQFSPCLRDNAYHLFNGTLCYVDEYAFNCKTESPVIAINVNGDARTDSLGILYRAETDSDYFHYAEIRGVYDYDEMKELCKFAIKPSEASLDSPIFFTGIKGQEHRRNPNNCVKYIIHGLDKDGRYELGLKFFNRFSQPLSTYFDIYLNKQLLFPRFSPSSFVSACKGMDLIAHLQVRKRLLRILGTSLEPTRIGNQVRLKLCYGDRKQDCMGFQSSPDYSLSGFHVLRFVPEVKYGCKRINEIQPGDKKECLGKEAGCECFRDTGECFDPHDVCPSVLQTTKCVRKGTYVAYGGVLCLVPEDNLVGCASNFPPLIAINVNGPDVTDKHGVTYRKEHASDYHTYRENNARNTISFEKTAELCEGHPTDWNTEQNTQLYYTMIHGTRSLANPGNCIEYPLPLDKDPNGEYELQLSFLEPFHEYPVSHFDVYLNSRRVLSKFDVYNYVGKCVGMDVIVKLTVREKMVHISGLSDSAPIDKERLRLQFCYGDPATSCVPDGGDPLYFVSAISLSKFRPESQEKVCRDVDKLTLGKGTRECSCHQAQCEYSVTRDLCRARTEFCAEILKFQNHCLRPDTFFAYGGVVCHVKSFERKDCYFEEEPLIAININGEDHASLKTGIKYRKEVKSDYKAYRDKRSTYSYNQNRESCKDKPVQIDLGDSELYYSVMHGSSKFRNKENCISYPIPITSESDGYYELGLFFMQHYQTNNNVSYFNVFLEDERILSRFDMLSYVQRCVGMNVYIHFTIAEGGTSLLIDGGKDSQPISGEKIHLRFCYGSYETNCIEGADPNYSASAFHIIKMRNATDGDICGKVQPGITMECNCRSHRACEYVIEDGICGSSSELCPNILEKARCLRKGTFYSSGGVICFVEESKGPEDCFSEEPLLAVNINGHQAVDGYNISFRKEVEKDFIPYRDHDETFIWNSTFTKRVIPKRNLITIQKGNELCDGLGDNYTKLHTELYYTMVTGREMFRDPKNCLKYPIKLTSTGDYELGFRFLNPFVSDKAISYFNVKLDNRVILSQFDVPKYAKKCTGMDVVVHFQVTLTKLKNGEAAPVLTIGGFKGSTVITQNTVTLSFCYGDPVKSCRPEGNPDYVISGFYVTRYRHPNMTSLCGSVLEGPDKECRCKAVGCGFILDTRECVDPDIVCPKILLEPRCIRDFSYYAHGGLLCNVDKSNNVAKKDCLLEKPILALNLHGKASKDSLGITYRAEKESDFEYRGVHDRHVHNGRDKCGSKSNKKTVLEKELYYSVVTGTGSEGLNCIEYAIALGTNANGEYELGMKFMELEHQGNGMHFEVYFNGKLVMSRFNIYHHVGTCNGMDVLIHFVVEDGVLRINGFKDETTIQGNSVVLSFCSNSQVNVGCQASKTVANYSASAFYVAKFRGMTDEERCALASTNECECFALGSKCVFDYYESGHCMTQREVCTRYLSAADCLLNNTLYAVAGVVCDLNQFPEFPRGGENCKLKFTVDAFNLGGETTTDRRWVRFDKVKKTIFDYIGDENPKELNSIGGQALCTGGTDRNIDREGAIFYSMIYGNSTSGENCLTHTFPVKEDGDYEIGIKVIDLRPEGKHYYYDIYLNDIRIINRLDLSRYVGSCVGKDVILHFLVGKDLVVFHGYGGPIELPERTMTLKFCSGGRHRACEQVKDSVMNYFVSGFYIQRFLPPSKENECLTIDQYHFNDGSTKECMCIRGGCPFRRSLGKCVYDQQVCKRALELQVCRRPNHFYVFDGIVCQNLQTSGALCGVGEVVTAINLGGGEVAPNLKGIVFQGEETARLRDPHGTKVSSKEEACGGQVTARDDEVRLYETHITGRNDKRNTSGCVTYMFDASNDGTYELNIKLAEVSSNVTLPDPRQRTFNIMLGSKIILRSFSIGDYVPRCTGMDLVIEFQIKEGKYWVNGWEGWDFTFLEGKPLSLSFCYGDCSIGSEPNYVAHAFSVILLGDTVNETPRPPTEEEVCARVPQWDQCVCIRFGCQYNHETGFCFHRNAACQKILEKEACLAEGTFITSGGILCKVKGTKGNCNPGVQVFALNFGDTKYRDVKTGIVYESHNTSGYPLYVENATDLVFLSKDSIKEKCGNGNPDIYYGAVAKLSGCMDVHVPNLRAGDYELGLKVMEHLFTQHSLRSFSVLLNGLIVLSRFDILAHVKHCEGMDISLRFQIRKRKMFISGYETEVAITDRKLIITFCYGTPNSNCNFGTMGAFLLSAIHVLKLKDFYEPPPACALYNGYKCDCLINGCQYDSFDDGCYPADKPCKETETSACAVKDSFTTIGTRYCKNPLVSTIDDCDTATTIFAVNLHGKAHTDKNGIRYLAEGDTSVWKVDHFHLRRVGNLSKGSFCETVEGIPTEDLPLYGTYVYGHHQGIGPELRCLTYYFPIRRDGLYQINIKTFEPIYDVQGHRYFTIRLQSKPVLSDIDLVTLAGAPCRAVELAVNFLVEGSGEFINTAGFERSKIINETGHLSFCYTTCEHFQTGIGFVVSAFSVQQITGWQEPMVPLPPTSGSIPKPTLQAIPAKSTEKPKEAVFPSVALPAHPCRQIPDRHLCECVAQDCDYYVANGGRCVPDVILCDRTTHFLPQECMRAKSFYSIGGVICKTGTVNDGQCGLNKKVIQAVNFNGIDHVDRTGLAFQGKRGEPPTNHLVLENGLKLIFDQTATAGICGKSATTQITYHRGGLTQTDERILLNGYLHASNATRSSQARCYHIPLKFEEDGWYELDIRSVETAKQRKRERQFNIKLNGVTIFPEIDIYKLVYSECTAIDLMLNFQILNNQNQIRIRGFRTMELKRITEGMEKYQTELSFCYGECGKGELWPHIDPNFISSAFSVAKFNHRQD